MGTLFVAGAAATRRRVAAIAWEASQPATNSSAAPAQVKDDAKRQSNVTKTNKTAPATTVERPEPAPAAEARPKAVRDVSSHLTVVESVTVAASGRVVILSDLKHVLTLFEMKDTAWSVIQAVKFPTHERLCHVSASASLLVISFRQQPFIELRSLDPLVRREPWRLALSFPAHRTAFETFGFALAVAQGTALKTWISIVDPLATTPRKSSTTRFVAHVGKVSALEWTSWTSLLVSAGHDGYVKVWAIEPQAHCVYRVHLDWQGIRSMALVERSSEEETNDPQTQTLLVTVSFSSVLETRELVGMHTFEATRRMKLDLHATQIQRIWKGRHTRELIAKYIKEDT
ncbi:hypothetical protein P43SY_002284 [Pythium insidiosum]|uniref:Uncharacterized protein n=1 Tax=Pythium insidiosum TaxID=114742 RepID=A0AAD5MB90_PYTIN|nr:hypothetical protein P43SY_002284 [Pythium insidiosum]